MSIVIAFDPSGNFAEGKGTTGVAHFFNGELQSTSIVNAEDSTSIEEHFKNHSNIIEQPVGLEIVCESYRLQRNKAMSQSGSSLETPQLIGYLRMVCWDQGSKFTLQDPSIKTRFNDDVLVNTGVLEKRGKKFYLGEQELTLHERDAIRHGLYYIRYGKKG